MRAEGVGRVSVANQYEVQMLALINFERAAHGLAALKLNAKLNTSAENHSRWMLQADVFSHTGAGGSSADGRMRDAGYVFSGNWASGENISWQSQRGAAGISDDVINLHNSLMNSPGHRANILNPNYVEIGIGIEVGEFTTSSGVDWPAAIVTQNFARSSADNGGPGSGLPAFPVTDGSDVVIGTANDDVIDALGGHDRLVGNLGNDTLSGEGGNDTLNGGEGNDWLEGGSGDDVLNGGAGFDRALFSGATAVTVNLGIVGLQDTGLGLDIFLDIEAVTSGSGADLLIGNPLANALNGGLGDDTIRGGAGNDTVNGADGDDVLTGGGGNDLVVGGAGNDTAVYAGAVGAVVNLATLTAQNTGLGIDTLSGIENLTGGAFADWLTGDAQANRLEGDAGNDTLRGAAGNDTLLGGSGDDRLGGGSGNDLLEGGLGADQFVFNTGGGNDFVADFEDGFDRIRIGTGAESFSDLVLSEIGSDTVITFSDVSITLAGITQTQITSSDFLFV